MKGQMNLSGQTVLYRFIYHYSEIELLNDKELKAMIPGLKDFLKQIHDLSVFRSQKKYKVDEVHLLEKKDNSCEFTTKSDESQFHSILRHLRDSIAHGLIKDVGNQYEFMDVIIHNKYNKAKYSQEETAHGRLSRQLVKNMMQCIVDVLDADEHEENNNQLTNEENYETSN